MMREQQSAPADVRVAILTRDNYTCQDCGLRGQSGYRLGDVQVHHLIGWGYGGDHSPYNLITLCVGCHKARDAQKRGEGLRAQYRRQVEAGEATPSPEWLRKHPDVAPRGRPRTTPPQDSQ